MGNKEGELAGIMHVQRQISFKKELEVEGLLYETLATLYALGSPVCLRIHAQFGDCWEKNLNSSLKIFNIVQIIRWYF